MVQYKLYIFFVTLKENLSQKEIITYAADFTEFISACFPE